MALKINPITGKLDLLGSTPDWNQSDETATDYIKNRTHYEKLEEHLPMSNADYEAKIAEGKSFTLVKMNSITIDNNQSLIINNVVQEGSQEEFNNLLDGIYGYIMGSSSYTPNSTLVSPKITINGKEVVLNWYVKDGPYNYSPNDTPDGLDTVMYGFSKQHGVVSGKYIYAEGFVLKDYPHATKVNGETMPDWERGTSRYETFLIDKTIYGEAPYTIDFYFEREQTIKKLDEKFLPDGIGQLKHKRGDVVILQQKRNSQGLLIGTKVISWEEFKNTYQNYAYPGDRYTLGEFPIGLVVDPVKRTFLYLRQLDGDIYSAIKSNISNLGTIGSTMYSNGIENSYQIKKKVNILAFAPDGDSIFYCGAGTQLEQFIPSLEESVICKRIIYDDVERFYERLIELSELMQDSTNYPGLPEPTGSVTTNLFYCFNSTIIEDGSTFYISDGYGNFPVVSVMNSGYMEFFGIYFND